MSHGQLTAFQELDAFEIRSYACITRLSDTLISTPFGIYIGIHFTDPMYGGTLSTGQFCLGRPASNEVAPPHV